jgi:hypothetical protein
MSHTRDVNLLEVRMITVRVSVVLPLLLTFFVTLDRAFACSCGGTPSPTAALLSADAVFLGEVISSRGLHVSDSGFASSSRYRFRVHRSWKGVRTDTVDVVTSSIGTACGFPFDARKAYLVYAYRGDMGGVRTALSTNSCSRTTPFVYAKKDLAELGEPIWINSAAQISLLSDELQEACRKGDTPRVRRLISAGHDVNGRDERSSALIEAAGNGHSDTVRVLLEAGAEVDDARGRTTPLVEAAKGGHVETVRVLLTAGADPNRRGTSLSPLGAAVEARSLGAVRVLMSAGARVEASIFYDAVASDETEIIDALMPSDSMNDRQNR